MSVLCAGRRDESRLDFSGFRTTAWSAALAVAVLAAACGPRDHSEGALYQPLVVTNTMVEIPPARRPLDPLTTGEVRLHLLQSELSPATLWRTAESTVTLFAGLERSGLGPPTFLAWSSPTGIAVAHPGRGFTGDHLRENWLLVGFPGAEGWTDWDSPWAVFLQRQPHRVRLTSEGLQLTFRGPAGSFTLLPLYGYYKPPQRGREFLSAHGLREKKLLTWEWAIVVARDPLVRLRYWSGVTRRFPYESGDSVIVDRRRDRVILRQEFRSLEVPDEWNTAPISAAPMSPGLGLLMISDSGLSVQASRDAFDFEMPTPWGPYHAVPGGESYELSLPVLPFVDETELPDLPRALDAPEPARFALEELRGVAGEILAGEGRGNGSGPGSRAEFERWIRDPWLLRFLLPLMEESRREAVLRNLGEHLRRSLEDSDAGGERLLEALWVYVHHTGNHEWLKSSWPVVRTWFDAPERVRWAAFGPTGEIGRVTPAIAYARLAWLAGDADQHSLACGIAARALALHCAQWRGTEWFRENQPWHSLTPIAARALPQGVAADPGGWDWSGEGEGVARSEAILREVRRDPDFTRAHRAFLGTAGLDVAREEAGADGTVRSALESLRAAGVFQLVRLIPDGGPLPAVRGVSRAVAGPHPVLLQEITVDPATGWPGITWSRWESPRGGPWSFGEVRVGDPPPGAPEQRPLNWNTVEWIWRE